ncbi:MAG: hypothetical protein ACI80V_002410 [Rhodothermales bacterium]|jgi:hypothetical protein
MVGEDLKGKGVRFTKFAIQVDLGRPVHEPDGVLRHKRDTDKNRGEEHIRPGARSIRRGICGQPDFSSPEAVRGFDKWFDKRGGGEGCVKVLAFTHVVGNPRAPVNDLQFDGPADASRGTVAVGICVN